MNIGAGYVSSDDILFKWRTGGTWSYSKQVETGRGHYPGEGICLLPTGHGIFLFFSEEGYVLGYHSYDGVRWRKILDGAVTSELEGTIFNRSALVNDGNIVLTAELAASRALLVSPDWGETWVTRAIPTLDELTPLQNIVEDSTGKLCVIGFTSSYQDISCVRTADQGQNWDGAVVIADFTDIIATADICQDGDHFFVAVDREVVHLAYSHDGGANWVQVSDASPNIIFPSFGTLGTRLKALIPSTDTLNLWVVSYFGDWILVKTTSDTAGFRGLGADGAGVWCGANKGIYRSTDHARTWGGQIASAGDVHYGFVATDQGGIWVAGRQTAGNLYRSADNGLVWSDVGETANWYSGASDRGGIWCVGKDGGILRSIDDGVNWATVLNSGDYIAYGIATDEEGVWVAALTTAYGVYKARIYRSTDDGANWGIADDLGDERALCVDTDRNGVWCVGTRTGITRSTDNGATWTPQFLFGGVTFMRSITTDGNGNWLAGGNNEGLVIVSRDNGLSWDIDWDSPYDGIHFLATDRLGVWCFGSSDVPGPGASSRIYCRSVMGAAWRLLTSVPDTNVRGIATDDSDVWCAVGDAGSITRSVDDGVSWAIVDTLVNNLCVATDESDVWCLGTNDDKIYRSTDNGATWALADTLDAAVMAIATDKNGVWCAATWDNGNIYRSADNGANWSNVDSIAGHPYCIATDEAGKWCLGDSLGKIHRSLDNGINWAEVKDTGEAAVFSLATDGAGVWCAGTSAAGKIFQSDDDGATWAEAEDTVSTSIRSLATDGSGNWYAGGGGDGKFYLSIDDGVAWVEAEYISETDIFCLAVDAGGLWFAGTGANGRVYGHSWALYKRESTSYDVGNPTWENWERQSWYSSHIEMPAGVIFAEISGDLKEVDADVIVNDVSQDGWRTRDLLKVSGGVEARWI